MTLQPDAGTSRHDTTTAKQRKHLVLHIEIPGFYADDLDQCAGYLSEPDPPRPEDRLYVVTEEWMRSEVGVTLVSLPGEKCMSDDFEVRAFTGRIVGADTRSASTAGRDAGGSRPLLTGTPGTERRSDATVDLARYIDDPEYRAMIDARIKAGRDAGGGTPVVVPHIDFDTPTGNPLLPTRHGFGLTRPGRDAGGEQDA